MPNDDFPILPETKVAALLDHFPQLEDVLIGMAPPFKKLKNPILRKSVAKVASLRQASAVGRIPIVELVNRLRAEVGQAPLASTDVAESDSYFTEQPDWFDRAKIVVSIEEAAADPNQMPLVPLLEKSNALEPTQILELITTFLPAPGIDIMREKGFLVWVEQESPEVIRTYISKSD
jgi:hypothetical protein